MNINGRMKVKTLRAEFKSEFGLTLRVYDGRSFADDDSTLASIRKGDNKGDEFSPRKSTKVGNLEDKIMNIFGIKVQISGSDDSYLCDNSLALAKALDKDSKKISRKSNSINNNTSTLDDTLEKYNDGDEGLDSVAKGSILSRLNELLHDLPEDEQYSTLETLLTAIDDDEIGGGMFFDASAEIYPHFDDVFSYARKQYSLDKDGLLKTIAELFTWYEKHGSENFDAEQAGETIQELIEEIEQYF
jgi:hypothetical protein